MNTIHSKATTPAYAEGHDRIFGKKNAETPEEQNTLSTQDVIPPVGVEPIDEKRTRLMTELKRCGKEWLEQDNISEEASFDSLGADSLDCIEMLMDIEETFDLEIDDDTAMKWITVKDVLDYLVVHVAS